MTMRFPAEIEAEIRQRVASGRFRDETDVIRVALRLLDLRERRVQQLRDSITEGFAAIERGELVELTPELMDELTREAEDRTRRGEQPNPDVCP